jgi:hypothetical protein
MGIRSREPNQCGSTCMRTQILFRLCRHKKLDFYVIYIETGTYSVSALCHKIYQCRHKSQGLLVHFGKFPCSWIRIQESQINADQCIFQFATLSASMGVKENNKNIAESYCHTEIIKGLSHEMDLALRTWMVSSRP